jgi:hypothetical protein
MSKTLILLAIGLPLAALAAGPSASKGRGDEKPPAGKRVLSPEEAEIKALEGWWDLSETVTAALGFKKVDHLYTSLRIDFVTDFSDPKDKAFAEADEHLQTAIRKDAAKRGHSIVAIGRLWTVEAGAPNRNPLKRAFTLTYRKGKTCLWVDEMYIGPLEVPIGYTAGNNTPTDDLLIIQYPGRAQAFKRRAVPVPSDQIR